MTNEDIERKCLEYSQAATPPYINGDFDRYAIAQAFEDGAIWRINSVWNKNDVTPGYDCHVLIEDVYGNIYDDRYYADYNEYESGITKKEIKCWAYVDDLLPESKGGLNNDSTRID